MRISSVAICPKDHLVVTVHGQEPRKACPDCLLEAARRELEEQDGRCSPECEADWRRLQEILWEQKLPADTA